MDGAAIIQIVTAFLGSLGFGMVFNMKPRHLITTAAGGMFAWMIYMFLSGKTGTIFFPTLCASIFSVLYGEVFARIHKCPANLYVVTTLIPLIPGGSLYYMMSNAVQNQWERSREYGSDLIMYVLGLAAGICLMSAILDIAHKFFSKRWKSVKGNVDKEADRWYYHNQQEKQ